MATLLAVGTSTASSSDFTIPAGGSAMLLLINGTGGQVSLDAVIAVESKVGSLYFPVYRIEGREGGRVIQGDEVAVTTWRVTRNPEGQAASVGVDKP